MSLDNKIYNSIHLALLINALLLPQLLTANQQTFKARTIRKCSVQSTTSQILRGFFPCANLCLKASNCHALAYNSNNDECKFYTFHFNLTGVIKEYDSNCNLEEKVFMNPNATHWDCPSEYSLTVASQKHSVYKLYTQQLFDTALVQCRNDKTKLVQTSTLQESVEIGQLLSANGRGSAWLDMTRDNTPDSNFVWYTSGEVLTYTNWAADQPEKRTDEIYGGIHSDGFWHDYVTWDASLSCLCECYLL